MTELHLDPGGPRSGDTTRQIADGLAECVRVLNHHTRDAAALPYPSTIYDVLGSLHAAVSGLDQLLRQLDARMTAMARTGDLADTSGDESTAALAQTWITESQAVSLHLSYALNRASQNASGLYLRDEDGGR